MQLSPRLGPTPTSLLRLPPSAPPRSIIPIPNVVPQIARRIPFGLTDPIPQPGEPVPLVLDLPIVCPWFPHRLEVVERAAGPRSRYAAVDGMVIMRGPAGVAPDGTSHEGGDVGFELVDGSGFGGEAVDRLGLVAVDEGEDVIGLCFWNRENRDVSCVLFNHGSSGKGVQDKW